MCSPAVPGDTAAVCETKHPDAVGLTGAGSRSDWTRGPITVWDMCGDILAGWAHSIMRRFDD